MQRKYKMTGCARFFLVMLILAPIAYLAASYYNNEDGIGNIKELFGIEETAQVQQEEPASLDESVQNPESENDSNNSIQEEVSVQQLRDHIKELEKENERLRTLLEEQGIQSEQTEGN